MACCESTQEEQGGRSRMSQLWAPQARSTVQLESGVSSSGLTTNTGWNAVYGSPTLTNTFVLQPAMPTLVVVQPTVWTNGVLRQDPRSGGTYYHYMPAAAPVTQPHHTLLLNGVMIETARNPIPEEPPESSIIEPDNTGERAPQHNSTKNKSSDIAWNQNYERLLKYKSKHGNCLVRQDYNDEYGDAGQGVSLGKWVGTQRTAKKNKRLSPYRTKKLEEIGFVWSTIQPWDRMFDRLVNYKLKFGHCDVPHDYAEDQKLSRWVRSQRKKKKHVLTAEQKQRLESTGFRWGVVHKEAWDDMYQRLRKYKDENGDCLVPFRYKPDPKLGGWVHNQRTLRRVGSLSDDCKQRLDDLGFAWRASHRRTWDDMFVRLVEYRATHGDCNVTSSQHIDPRLGSWVSSQRCKRRLGTSQKRGGLTQLQIERLDDIGFVWDMKVGAWDNMFSRLVDFKRKNGHCSVPWHYKPDPQLGNWLMKQRLDSSVLTREQVDKLGSVGFSMK